MLLLPKTDCKPELRTWLIQGVRCHAWLYLPVKSDGDDISNPPPIVVMGHGLGGQKVTSVKRA